MINNKSVPKKEIGWVIFLLFFGVVASYILVRPFQPLPDDIADSYMPVRLIYMTNSIEAFKSAKLPDLSESTDHAIGLYVYGGYLGARFNLADYQVFLLLQYAAAFILQTVMPLEIWLVSKLKGMSLITPLAIHFILGKWLYMQKTDGAWAAIWCMVLCLPLICLIVKERWKRKSWGLLGIICILMGCANVMRSQSSVYILILLIAGIIFRLKTDRMEGYKHLYYGLMIILISLFLIGFTYDLIGIWIPAKIYAINGIELPNVSNTMWHNIYIGLGFGQNKYGIYYKDECGLKHADLVLPGVEYGTNEYYRICRKMTFDIVKSDPLFCMSVYIKKFIFLCVQCIRYLSRNKFDIAILLLAGFTCIYNKKKSLIFKEFKPWLVMCFAGIFIGMLQPMLSYPALEPYGYATLGAIGLLILGILMSIYRYWVQQKILNL